MFDYLSFLREYAGLLFATWFGIAGTVLTAFDVWQRAGLWTPSGMSVNRSRILLRTFAVMLFFLASAQVYKQLEDHKPPESPILAENPDHAGLIETNKQL